jgi:hypothetical protein
MLACGSAAALAAPAVAAPREEVELRFAGREPAAVAGLRLGVLYRGPGTPEGKPSPVRAAVIEAPAGTRFGGGSAIPACPATDDELRLQGRDACPAASRVAGGFLTAVTGTGPPFDPVRTDATVYKTADGFVEIVQQPGSNATLGIDRARISGSTITLSPPVTPGGPPDGETAVREARFDFGATGFVVTPPKCPSDGLWRTVARYRFADGHTAVVGDASPCRVAATPPAAPRGRVRLAVSPRSVPAGVRVRYRFRVYGAGGDCRAGALVRFAGRRMRTDASGRAATTVRLTRRGSRPVVASKPGCATVRAAVTVRRAVRSA